MFLFYCSKNSLIPGDLSHWEICRRKDNQLYFRVTEISPISTCTHYQISAASCVTISRRLAASGSRMILLGENSTASRWTFFLPLVIVAVQPISLLGYHRWGYGGYGTKWTHLLWRHHCGPCHIFGWCSWPSRFLTTAAFTSGRLKGRNETGSYSCTTYLRHLNPKIRTIRQFLDNYDLRDRQRYWFSGRTEPGGASNSVIMPHTDQSICPLADVFEASVSKPNTASD